MKIIDEIANADPLLDIFEAVANDLYRVVVVVVRLISFFYFN